MVGGGNPATMTCSEKLKHHHTAGDGKQSKTVKGKDKRRKKLRRDDHAGTKAAQGWQTGRLRQAHGQAFSDSGYPYDAGMGESRPAYLEIGPLQ